MPRCNHCGVENPEGARFCMSCGKDIGTIPLRPTPRSGSQPSAEDMARADRMLTEAFSLSDEGRLTESVRVTQQVLAINPHSTTAHSLLGTLYERLGNRDAAIREYQTVLSLSPGSSADRQRLNELLGLPATPQVARPTIRKTTTAKRPDLLYGGIILVLVFVIVGVVALIGRSGKDSETSPESTTASTTTVASMPPAPSNQASITPSLPSFSTPAPAPTNPAPSPNVPTPAPSAAPPPTPTVTTVTGNTPPGRQIIVLRSPGGDRQVEESRYFLPEGGILLTQPVRISTPQPQTEIRTLGVAVQPSVNLARQYVLSGRLNEASRVYEATLAVQPRVSPKLRMELATVYTRTGESRKAAIQYRRAFDLYEEQLSNGVQGVDAEDAQHGLSTCRAALRALGFRLPSQPSQ
jgi:Tfp pilus assembly protein PilF